MFIIFALRKACNSIILIARNKSNQKHWQSTNLWPCPYWSNSNPATLPATEHPSIPAALAIATNFYNLSYTELW